MFRRQQDEVDKALLADLHRPDADGGDEAPGASSSSVASQWAINARRKRKRPDEKDMLKGVKLRKSLPLSLSGATAPEQQSPADESPTAPASGDHSRSSKLPSPVSEPRSASVPTHTTDEPSTEEAPLQEIPHGDLSPSTSTAAALPPKTKPTTSNLNLNLGLAGYSSDEE